LKRVRPLDAAIIVVVVAVLAVGGYLGYRLWANANELKTASPAAREIEALKAQLKKKPNNIDVRMRLAQALSVSGRDAEAVEQYQAVLKVNKEFVPAMSGIGFELMKQKDWKGGEGYFRKVIALTEGKTSSNSPNSPLEIAYYYTGIALMEQKSYSDAAGFLRRALALKRDSSDTAYALAFCYKQLDIMDGYSSMLQYALQFDPKMPEANYDYGLLLLSQGDKAGAAEHFRTSSEMAPYKAEPKTELQKLGPASARLAAAKKLASTDASAALGEARIAAALEPDSVEALLLTASLYEKKKDKTKAAEVYQKVLLLDPTNAEATAGSKRVNSRGSKK
jgi:tetratricopeptide (TPR) repeat protein